MWGLVFEIVTLLSVMVSFTLLGRTLGPAGYGGYASLFAIVAPLVTLAASGVMLALLDHAVRADEPLDETARSCVSLALVLGLVLVVVAFGISTVVVQSLSVVAIVSILLTEFITSPLIFVASGVVQSADDFVGATKIRISLYAIRTIVVIGLFAFDSLTVASLGVTHLLATTLLAAFLLRRVGKRYGFRFLPGPVRLRHLKTNITYSSAISAYAVQNDGDKTVLAANGFTVDTGLYAAAYRIVLLGMVPISTMIDVTHRRFLAGDDGTPGAHLRMAIRFGVPLALYGLVLGGALYVAAPVLPIVLGDEFDGSVTMVRWLAPVVGLRALSMFALNALMGLGRIVLRTVLIAVVAAIGLAIYIVAVPERSWEGAVFGTLVSETLLVAVTWGALVVCQRRADVEATDGVPVQA